MTEERGLIGGFVACNTGKIENCYCVTSFNGKKYTSGGFVGENKGTIAKSFCEYAAKGLSGGFSGTRTQLGDGCFFVHDLDAESKKVEPLWDRKYGIRSRKIKNANDAARAGYDMKNIWSFTGQKPLLQFQEDNWMFPDTFRFNPSKQILSIKDAKNLFLFAEMVNNGDKRFVNAKVRLDADIDLKGKTWVPIGIDRGCAFCGVFDGNGYSVTNFVIKDDHYAKKGFFGYLKGDVFNLTIDCQIRGDGCVGGIAAVNEGTIGCCGATVGLYGKGSDLNAGGLVGMNNGHIFQSYAAGKIKLLMIPVIPIAVVASSAMVLSAAVFSGTSGSGDSIYNPVEKDPNQEQIAGDNTTQPDHTGSTEAGSSEDDTESGQLAHSLGFTLSHSVSILLDSGDCLLDFSNPADNTNSMVIKLSIENEDGSRTAIAKSGAILPGYQVRSISLLDGVTLDAGEYTGYVTLIPYDIVTNDKSMIETELPVSLSISK